MPTKKIARKQADEIAELARLREAEIDLSDSPEVKSWTRAVVGKFYRPMKRPLTIRLDADVLAWLKRQGKGYQTRINSLLRSAMDNETRARRKR